MRKWWFCIGVGAKGHSEEDFTGGCIERWDDAVVDGTDCFVLKWPFAVWVSRASWNPDVVGMHSVLGT